MEKLLISKYDQEAFPLPAHNYNCHVIKNINEAYEDLKYLINNPKLKINFLCKQETLFKFL